MIPTLFLRTCLTRLNLLQTDHSICFPAYFFFFFGNRLSLSKQFGASDPSFPAHQHPNPTQLKWTRKKYYWLKLIRVILTSNGGCCDYFKSLSLLLFFLVAPCNISGQSKRISRLVYGPAGIPAKISVDSLNLGQIRLIYNKKILI